MVSSSFVMECNDVTVANAKVEVVHLLWWIELHHHQLGTQLAPSEVGYVGLYSQHYAHPLAFHSHLPTNMPWWPVGVNIKYQPWPIVPPARRLPDDEIPHPHPDQAGIPYSRYTRRVSRTRHEQRHDGFGVPFMPATDAPAHLWPQNAIHYGLREASPMVNWPTTPYQWHEDYPGYEEVRETATGRRMYPSFLYA
jgi:hypothetical protein